MSGDSSLSGTDPLSNVNLGNGGGKRAFPESAGF